MNSREQYLAMAKTRVKPGSEKIVCDLLSVLNSEDRFFSQSEVDEHLKVQFETSESLRKYRFYYLDLVYHAPIYFFKIYNSSYEFSQLIFCSKQYFIEISTAIIQEIFESTRKSSIPVRELEVLFRKNFELYLGLRNRELKPFNTDDMSVLLENLKGVIHLHSTSAIDQITDLLVSVKPVERDQSKLLSLQNELINIVRRNSLSDIKKILLKLNLSKNEYWFSKPYTISTMNTIVASFPGILEIHNSELEITPLKRRIESSLNEKFMLDNFPLRSEKLSGLLIFSFIGDNFPIKEASSYVALRNQVYFAVTYDLQSEYDKFTTTSPYELPKTLNMILKDETFDDWANRNLAVSFVIDDYDYLKLNFDKLMEEYSPVFNIRKNPGNLFRGIIEEKIREYESGKQQ